MCAMTDMLMLLLKCNNSINGMWVDVFITLMTILIWTK